jgi:3-isopropylmalate dehydratase small subunit
LVGNPGCAGCAAGQIGQNGPKEVTISTGNRNFVGKQGRGEVYLASPETAAASAISGIIRSVDNLLDTPKEFEIGGKAEKVSTSTTKVSGKDETVFEGRVWVIDEDNIDTDMIYHNRYLAITDMSEMGQYAFDNLKGWEDFAKKVKKNDIIITGKNFGCGSSRQQAVDCFKALGVNAIVASSFGAIYERNAINAAMPIITFENDLKDVNIKNGDKITLDLTTSEIKDESGEVIIKCNPFSKVQMDIYRRGGLLQK